MKVHIVLYQPEIPPNTANIMRTCVATNTALHLIHPLGFDLNYKANELRRSSTNFIDQVELYEYDSFDEFVEKCNPQNIGLLTRYGKQTYDKLDATDAEDFYIVFGKESSGIPQEILKKYENDTFRIPMSEKMRSINLSNCAAMITYELLRQTNFEGLEMAEPHKIDYI
ncbi:tRNA (cytidine(34)-2'-O)-methyltransferase [Mollicutes bacterium LVI A0075]|nr:tRNA (cytidine(34)-2'-O)-methyltransferase [Mollicutes bacterium LVI A0075]